MFFFVWSKFGEWFVWELFPWFEPRIPSFERYFPCLNIESKVFLLFEHRIPLFNNILLFLIFSSFQQHSFQQYSLFFNNILLFSTTFSFFQVYFPLFNLVSTIIFLVSEWNKGRHVLFAMLDTLRYVLFGKTHFRLFLTLLKKREVRFVWKIVRFGTVWPGLIRFDTVSGCKLSCFLANVLYGKLTFWLFLPLWKNSFTFLKSRNFSKLENCFHFFISNFFASWRKVGE